MHPSHLHSQHEQPCAVTTTAGDKTILQVLGSVLEVHGLLSEETGEPMHLLLLVVLLDV